MRADWMIGKSNLEIAEPLRSATEELRTDRDYYDWISVKYAFEIAQLTHFQDGLMMVALNLLYGDGWEDMSEWEFRDLLSELQFTATIPMIVLVAGGRDYTNRKYLDDTLSWLDRMWPIGTVVHGDAPGADAMAAEWAGNGTQFVIPYPADWKKHGRRAGILRNLEMLDHPGLDYVVTFPGGTGTDHTRRTAKKRGIPVFDMDGVGVPASVVVRDVYVRRLQQLGKVV